MGMSAIKSEKNSIGAEAQPDYTIDIQLYICILWRIILTV